MAQHADRSCPYCGNPLKWIPMRWFGRGTFECDHCGEFPDFSAHAHADDEPHPRRAILRAPYSPVRRVVSAAVTSRPTVLMIDDSNEERDLYALMLEHEMTVLTASRGADGLALAASDLPDAIILDLMMPGMDGFEVCRRLKADDVTRAIPVIMLTGEDRPTLADEAASHGVAALLTKPCPVEKLTRAIAAAMHATC